MKLPGFKRLTRDDYPEDFKDTVEKLSFIINNGIEPLYEALNRRVSLKDNISGTQKDVTVEVDSTGAPKSITSFQLDKIAQVTGTLVIRADNLTNNQVYPTGGVFVSFSQTSNTVIINNIAGLPANYKFLLRIFAFQD